jgi:predicted N-acetyltransferase YhbS
MDVSASDYANINDPTGFDPRLLSMEAADQHLAVVSQSMDLQARCSLWWRDTVRLDGQRVGAIGHYAATDSGAGRAVIRQAMDRLRAQGCSMVVGPMNGNTWRSYRFVVERGTAQPFFLEPTNPDSWPVDFTECGFEPLSWYVSEINYDIANRQPQLGPLREKMDRLGVQIAPLSLNDSANDVDGIFGVVCESFRESFLYTPLDRDTYRSIYGPLLQKIDPRLILVAKHDGRVVGFVFAPPDYLQQAREIDAIVIKTFAILPHKCYSGLGRVLIVDMLKNALDMGYTTAISALMHTENRSQEISSDCAGPMRRYALFAKGLRP